MKLTDTQILILSAAAQRDRCLALPFPETMKARGGAATKVVESMIAKSLIATAPARAGDPVWRETDDGGALTLVATDDGLAAIGIEPDAAPEPATAAQESEPATQPRARRKAAPDAPTATVAGTRPGTKQAALIDMLRRPEGASTSEISDAFGWRAHTVRGAISGALKKKLGLDVQSEKVDGRGTVYSLPAEG